MSDAVQEYLTHIANMPEHLRGDICRDAEKALYRESLYLTAKFLLGYSEVNHQTHGEMIEVLEGKSPFKLVVMPRGTFKTSVAVVAYPIWCVLRDSNERIVLDSELFTNSKKSMREIAMHLQSPKVVQLYGDFKGPGVWNESELLINQRTIVKKEATFTCSGIGAQKTGQHYNRAILDDMSSPQNTNTPENRQKVIDHYRYYQSILEPGGERVVVGTRYHEDDLIGYCLKNEIFLSDDD